MEYNVYSLEVITVCNSFPKVRALWDILSETHNKYVGMEVNVARTHSSILYEKYGEYIENNNLIDIGVDLASGSIHYGNIPDLNFARLDINDLVLDFADAEKWLSKLLYDDRFIQARIYEREYDKWENMEDLLSFQAAERSYEGLTLKSNGLTFPLEQKVIDISSNPGRWKLKQGYIESVGSVMWLGNQFWENTGVSKDKVLACDWLQLEEVGRIIKIKAQDKPFITAEGLEGKLQNKLRDLLYP